MRILRWLGVVSFAAAAFLSAGRFSSAVAKAKSSTAGINTKALLHDTRSLGYRSPFGAVPAGTTVTLRLRTAHAGASSVTVKLETINPQTNATASAGSVKLKMSKRAKKYDTWQGSFTAKDVTIYGYAFQIKKGKSTVWYADSAALIGGTGQVFRSKPSSFFRVTSYDAKFTIPSWVPNMSVYEIFPDRFYNGDPTNDHSGMDPVYNGIHPVVHSSWNEPPNIGPNGSGELDFYGGDLQGIIDKLPYLKSLGVNTLFLTPIFKAATNHKYDTADYYTIDPRFGTMQTLTDLLQKAHDQGLHVILDGVFNHTGSDSIYFNAFGHFPDVGAYQSQSSPYYPWYSFSRWPDIFAQFPGTVFGGIGDLPQLQEIDQVKDFIYRQPDSVAQHWLTAGTDGWRLDSAQLKSFAWWQDFRSNVKSRFPDDIIVAEDTASPVDAIPYLMGNMMDGVMNYRFRTEVLDFFGHGAGDGIPRTAKAFFSSLMGMVEEYPLPALYSTFNLVGSHDTERVSTLLAGNKPVLKEIIMFQATWLGAPMIYYGDETGLQNGPTSTDERKRMPFPWDSQDTDLEGYFSKVLNIRQSDPALRDGTISPLVIDSNHRVVSFLRKDAHQSVAVVINDEPSTRKLTLKLGGVANGTQLTDQVTGKTYTVSSGKVSVTAPASGSMILAMAVTG